MSTSVAPGQHPPGQDSPRQDPAEPVDVDADGAVALTAELVRARSVHEPGRCDERKAADVVLAKMAEWGWAPEVTEVAPGRPNVVVTIEGGGGAGPILGFEGHLDVVTEGDPAEWSHDPYGAEIVDGRLYGRGSADMKSGVAAMLYATRALQQAGPFPGAVRLFVCSDEEGMMLGAKQLVARGDHRGVAGVVVCEPEGLEVCACSKGAIRLRIELTGKMAHGAMPHQGRNPLPVLGRVLAAVSALEADLQARNGTHEHLGTTYVTPTVARAGEAVQMNTIPARAELFLDVRTIPGVDHGELIATLRREAAALGAAAGVEATVEVIDDRPPVDTPLDDPLVTAVVEAHRHVFGDRPAYGGVPGTTDGTILTVYGQVPTVVYGPGGKWIAHQADEFVEVAEIGQYARAYAEAARRFLTRPAP